ncbi:MAG: CobQ/CobB/MinD/ParA nucleotide binding domain protein [Firmicutes bacterium ADurb.BinA205]|nr:MAG: CobQ/CobB/MinD/ParA nucleotide binding domain protein [Firmicutes bacterium ADurb.BinA205]
MKKITIVTGHYGSGKTTFAVNLAVKAAAEGKSAAIVDLDIVNPYFRTADFRDMFEEKGIKLIAPDFANSNLDIPSIQFDVVQLAMNEDCLIIDVGGDDAGAVALGRYAEELEQFSNDIDMVYVINQRRTLTTTSDEVTALMYEIEAAARMKHTAIINNTNLGNETTLEIVDGSRKFAEETSQKTGLPVMYTVYPEDIADTTDAADKFSANICVKPIWER